MAIAAASLMGSCGVYEVGVYGSSNDGEENAHTPYVNTYISLPYEIKALIEDRVSGFFSPSSSRYCSYLYDQETARSSNNLPCFVKTDLNGDWVDDYVFLFTDEDLYSYSWEITTKLLVVLSTSYGYEVATDVVLGTISADNDVPIEEYWSICRIPAGSYTTTTESNGILTETTTYLDEDAFVLSYLDDNERDLFYVSDNEVFYMPWGSAGFAKKRTMAPQDSSIHATATWHDKVEKRIKQ
jgi:hypothetical protein